MIELPRGTRGSRGLSRSAVSTPAEAVLAVTEEHLPEARDRMGVSVVAIVRYRGFGLGDRRPPLPLHEEDQAFNARTNCHG